MTGAAPAESSSPSTSSSSPQHSGACCPSSAASPSDDDSSSPRSPSSGAAAPSDTTATTLLIKPDLAGSPSRTDDSSLLQGQASFSPKTKSCPKSVRFSSHEEASPSASYYTIDDELKALLWYSKAQRAQFGVDARLTARQYKLTYYNDDEDEEDIVYPRARVLLQQEASSSGTSIAGYRVPPIVRGLEPWAGIPLYQNGKQQTNKLTRRTHHTYTVLQAYESARYSDDITDGNGDWCATKVRRASLQSSFSCSLMARQLAVGDAYDAGSCSTNQFKNVLLSDFLQQQQSASKTTPTSPSTTTSQLWRPVTPPPSQHLAAPSQPRQAQSLSLSSAIHKKTTPKQRVRTSHQRRRLPLHRNQQETVSVSRPVTPLTTTTTHVPVKKRSRTLPLPLHKNHKMVSSA